MDTATIEAPVQTTFIQEEDTSSEVESRQGDIVDEEAIANLHVALLGLGTAGSWTAPLLMKLGVGHLEMWDLDEVERANLSCQAYGEGHLEMSKPEALSSILRQVHPGILWKGQISLHEEPFHYPPEGKTKMPKPDVIVSCLDNWTGRSQALDWAVANKSGLFIETRMIARYRIVHAVDPKNEEDVAWLRATFGEDGDSPGIPCGLRGAAFLGASVASEVASAICNHVNGETVPREMPYDLGLHLPIVLND